MISACLVAALGFAQEPGPKELTIDDLFTLGKKAVVAQERPLGWIDGSHYLVFDAGVGTVGAKTEKVKSFWKVDAVTGQRSFFLDWRDLMRSLGELPGFTEGWAQESLAESDLQWNDDYSAALLNTANDLFYCYVESADACGA